MVSESNRHVERARRTKGNDGQERKGAPIPGSTDPRSVPSGCCCPGLFPLLISAVYRLPGLFTGYLILRMYNPSTCRDDK